jgi:hypothetical protein
MLPTGVPLLGLLEPVAQERHIHPPLLLLQLLIPLARNPVGGGARLIQQPRPPMLLVAADQRFQRRRIIGRKFCRSRHRSGEVSKLGALHPGLLRQLGVPLLWLTIFC